jgi:hypothetical protein
VTAREATDDVMPERARRVHHLESLLLNCEFRMSRFLEAQLLTYNQPWWIRAWGWTWWSTSRCII